MLSNHNSPGRESSTPDSWDGEELDEASKVVVLLNEGFLNADLGENVVKITSSLELGVTKTLQRSKCFLVATLFNIPSRRFWAEVDTSPQGYGRDKS